MIQDFLIAVAGNMTGLVIGFGFIAWVLGRES